jgi:hypothetical protein
MNSYPLYLFTDALQDYTGFHINSDVFYNGGEFSAVEEDLHKVDMVLMTINYYVQRIDENTIKLNEVLSYFHNNINLKQSEAALTNKINQLEKYLIGNKLFDEVLRLKVVRESIYSCLENAA